MIDFIKSRVDEILEILNFCCTLTLDAQKTNNIEVFKKQDNTNVSEYDFAVEHIICGKLKEIFGNLPIVSEEFEYEENLKNIKEPLHFILDPIDGTASFLNGTEYSTNLGVMLNGKCELSFLACPQQEIIMFSLDGKVFSYSTKNNTSKEIQISKKLNSKQFNVCVSRTFENRDNKIQPLLQSISSEMNKPTTYHKLAGSVKYAKMIMNDFDASVSLKGFKYWDLIPLMQLISSAQLEIVTNQGYEKNLDPLHIFNNLSSITDVLIVKKEILNFMP